MYFSTHNIISNYKLTGSHTVKVEEDLLGGRILVGKKGMTNGNKDENI